MDSSSRNVLKRKEFMLRHHLQWNDALTEALRRETVISDDNINKIKKQKEANGKTAVLMDRISSKGRPNEITTIADALDETRLTFTPDWYNSWLADELREEMAVELEKLPISEEITTESATIVHREFGHRKRLSELEKKVVVGMLGMRTQMTKNIWQQRCVTNAKDAQQEREALNDRETRAAAMGEETTEYVGENSHRVKMAQATLRPQTSRGALLDKQEEKPQDLYKTLRKNIDHIQRILGASLLAAETLDKERVRVLKAMGLTSEQISAVLLDEEIHRALERNQRQIEEADARIINRGEECEALKQEITQYKLEHANKMRNREKNIQILQSEVNRSDERMGGMSQELKDLIREVRIAKLELEEWKDWYMSIEHSKRLHNIYQRDLPKLRAKGMIPVTASQLETDDELPTLQSLSDPSKNRQKKPEKKLVRTMSRNKLQPVQTSMKFENGKKAPFKLG